MLSLGWTCEGAVVGEFLGECHKKGKRFISRSKCVNWTQTFMRSDDESFYVGG